MYIIIFILLFLTGCQSEDVAFQNFTHILFQSEVTSTTIGLHYTLENPEAYEITSVPVTFGTFHSDTLTTKVYFENLKSALESFSYASLSPENQLTYDVVSSYIDVASAGCSFYLYEEPLSPLTGIHAQLPVLLAEYQFHSTDDIETYLSLLRTLPDYFDSLIQFEKEKAKAGLFMSDSVADEVIAQCHSFVEMGNDNYLISTFEERINSLNTTNYIEENREIVLNTVLPAYKKLANTITELKGTGTNKSGLCYYPDGTDYYKYLVRYVTGSSRNISELRELIQNQIDSDTADLKKVLATSSNITMNLTPEETLTYLQSKIVKTFPSSPDVSVEIKQVPHSLEKYLSPAYYLIPPIDNYTENVIYINNHYSMDNISLFTTLAHEGYPGHLYQTTYYASTNPDPIRTCLNFNGYVEGWATYAEMCSYYISPLDKPLATLLQKNSSVVLGLYAAADIGIHYDGWDEKETYEFFSSYGIEEEDTVAEIYKAILGDPANYLSYYVGYVEILELKKEYVGTQMEFHKELLEIGPAPFCVIKEYLE